MLRVIAVLGVAAAAGLGVGVWPLSAIVGGARAEPISGCRATDGDTIRCGDERIRLLGIDAPELPGHCRRGRRCVAGDPYASTAALAADLRGPLTIERVGVDRYGRTLALVANARGDLGCAQVRRGAAAYVARWDRSKSVARRLENRCQVATLQHEPIWRLSQLAPRPGIGRPTILTTGQRNSMYGSAVYTATSRMVRGVFDVSEGGSI